MNAFLNWLISIEGQIFVIPAIVLLGLLVVLLRSDRQNARLRGQVAELEERLEGNLLSRREDEDMRAQRAREEMSLSMRGMGDSMMRMVGEMARTQQNQMDSFSAQLRAIGSSEEERMERMRQSVEHRLERVGTVLDEKLTGQEGRMNQMRDTVERRMEALLQNNQQKLDEMRQTVDEKLHASLDKRLGESFQMVSERLEQVYRGLGEMQSLATGVGDLKRVLSGVKTRGVWGELQLATLLEQILTPDQYETNVAVKPNSGERVEFALKLPGREEDGSLVYLPIDAKFPQEDYQRILDAVEAGDAAGVEQAGRQLEVAIRAQAKLIRDKYIQPPHTTDFAVMFLPLEGLFAEVLRRPGLSERVQNEFRVTIAGPTTLAALLNSLQMGFRTLAIERRASEVWTLLGAVKTEFGRFADILSRTQKKLRQASDSIEDAARKTRVIQRKLRTVEELSERETQKVIGEDPLSLFSDAAEEAGEAPQVFEGEEHGN